MKKTDLLVIGGSAGGILSATMARKAYGDIDITVIRDTDAVMVPCGIPYIYGTLHCTSKNVIPDKMLADAKINLVVETVVKIDKDNKTVTTKNNDTYSYKKLVIATGSLPIIPTFIPGHELENVFPIYKNQDYLNTILEKLETVDNVAVIGGGFIGVEFAEQISMTCFL
ncbi:MAG: FAD-dependent oxidoreductase [Synergistaceae bacterium]